MDIQKVRRHTKMSQRKFSEFFGIPLGTLRNWEQGKSKPPEYVYAMIAKIIGRSEEMVNVETVKFIKMLDELAELSKEGIEDFANAKENHNHDMVFYDKSTEDLEGGCRIVLDSCVIDNPECLHHDAISYYDRDMSEYTIRVIFDEDDGIPYIHVHFVERDELIVIQDGKWYFA